MLLECSKIVEVVGEICTTKRYGTSKHFKMQRKCNANPDGKLGNHNRTVNITILSCFSSIYSYMFTARKQSLRRLCFHGCYLSTWVGGFGLCPRGSPSRRVSIQVGLQGGVSVQGEGSLSRGEGSLSRKVSVQGRGLCPGGGVSVQWGRICFQGKGSLSRRGLCPVGGVSVQGRGSLYREGGSVQRGLCPGGLCPGGRDPLYGNEQVVCIKLECILVNKNAFQWDAYCPLVNCIPACTVVGGVSVGGVPALGGTYPGGVLARGWCTCRGTPPVNRMTDRQV